MAEFKFKAVGADGKVASGQITAADRGEALRALGKRGLQPVSVKQEAAVDSAVAAKVKTVKAEKARGAPKKIAPAKAAKPKVAEASEAPAGPIKLKRKDVVFFTEELSEMLAAGLQLEPALRTMENREELGGLKEVAVGIRQLVRDGASFSVALHDHLMSCL